MNAKRLLAILLIASTLFTLFACDFTSETSSKGNTSKTSDISNTVDNSSSVRDDSSAQPSDSSESDNTRVFSGVNVVLSGVSALEKSGFAVDGDFSMTIDVTLKGDADKLDSLLAADISAAVDVSAIAEEGTFECLIDIIVPDIFDVVNKSESLATVKIKKKATEIKPVTGDTYIAEGGVIIVGTRGMEPYSGSAKAGALTAEKMNEFKQAVGDGINVYVLAAPLASAFYAPEKYPNSIANHKNCFEGLRDALVGVKYVDALSALSAHVNEDIYARTDHHWNALGAYYAAKQFSNVAGTPFDDISTFTSQTIEGVVGSLYTYSKAKVLKDNPDTFTWYIPTRDHEVVYYSRDKFTNPVTGRTLFSSAAGYTKFIYGDSYITDIKTNVGNGRKLLLFKDSYGNALAPFLVSQFDEVIIADFRYFQLSAKQFIADHGITDVCFSLSAFAVSGKSRNYITSVL